LGQNNALFPLFIQVPAFLRLNFTCYIKTLTAVTSVLTGDKDQSAF